MTENNPILTITGSDSTGLSGVQADIKTISALGGYAVSAITSITVQNTLGIQEFFDVPAKIVAGQIDAIINDMEPQVVKLGMIRSVDVLNVIIDALVKYHPRYVIYDPVFFSSKGEKLMDDNVMVQIQRRLIPLCSLVVTERYKLHGESNTYSSAIAAYLGENDDVEVAIAKAKNYVNAQLVRVTNLMGCSSELYNKFLDAIADRYKVNSDVAFYADYLNVSSRYLAQVTKRICNKAPKMLIDEYLVGQIQIALNTTKNTIQEIAYDFGFSSQAHFAKFFKKMTGETPSKFRKNKLYK